MKHQQGSGKTLKNILQAASQNEIFRSSVKYAATITPNSKCVITHKSAHATLIRMCQREKDAICFLVKLVTDTAEGCTMH